MALPFSSVAVKLRLNGSLAPGEDVGRVAVPFGQDFEKTVIFPLNRFGIRFRRHAFQGANAAPRGRWEC